MNKPRKPRENREKEIMLTATAISKGRSKHGESKVSFSAVARELGITPALIHNHYPKAAEHIRTLQNRSSRMLRDMKQDELKIEKKKNSDFRNEVKELKFQIAQLASLNEILKIENRSLQAQIANSNVVGINSKVK